MNYIYSFNGQRIFAKYIFSICFLLFVNILLRGADATVSSYTELKALTGASTADVVSGTGLDGHFYLDTGSSETANRGTVFVPDSGPGRWKRIYDKSYVLLDWFDVSDPDAAIASALTVNTNIKCPGDYTFSDDIDLINNARLFGGGILRFNTTKGINVDNVSRFTIENLSLYGSESSGQALIYIHNTSDRWDIKRVDFYDSDIAVYATNTWCGIIKDCWIRSSCNEGVFLAGGTGNCSRGTSLGQVNIINIENNIIESADCGVRMGITGDMGSHCKTIYVTGNTIEGNTTGIILQDTYGVYLRNYHEAQNVAIKIDGNYNYGTVIEGCSFWGDGSYFTHIVEQVNCPYSVFGLTIKNCVATNPVGGISGTAALTSLTLIANQNVNIETLHRYTVVKSINDKTTGTTFCIQEIINGDYSVRERESGMTFGNINTTATRTCTLPEAKTGMEYSFCQTGTNDLIVDPDGIELFRGQGAGKYVKISSQGGTLHLKCHTAGIWDIVSQSGTISYEP